MTNRRRTVQVAAVTACLIASAFGRSVGAEGPPKKKAEGVRKTVSRALKKIQDEQGDSARHIANLEKEVQALRADVRSLLTELHALRGTQEPPRPVVEAMPDPTGPAVVEVPEPPNPADEAKKPAEPGVFRFQKYNDPAQGEFLLVVSPDGDRVALSDPKTGETRTLKLSGDKAHPHEVRPGYESCGTLVALAIGGPKITRLAVLSYDDGAPAGSPLAYHWYPIDLPEPVDSAVPDTVGGCGTAVYTLGRRVYAFSQPAHRWDVLELPRGVAPSFRSSNEGPTIENDGHIYTFVTSTGQWRDLDVRAILDPPEKKRGDPAQ